MFDPVSQSKLKIAHFKYVGGTGLRTNGQTGDRITVTIIRRTFQAGAEFLDTKNSRFKTPRIRDLIIKSEDSPLRVQRYSYQ